ncbi:MAG: hypothetical protein RR313_04325 [Anaerovoracaceae bacterium]
MDFDLIFEQLQSLEQQFVDFDPSNKPYTKVQGMFNSFVLTNTVTNLGNGRLKCSEIFQDSVDIIGLGIFQRERLSVNRTIILSDRLIVSEGKVKCFLAEATLNDLVCLRTLQAWASATGLSFYNETPTEILSKLIADGSSNSHSDRTIWHLTANLTNLALEKNPIGYVVCKSSNESSNSTDFSEILQSKYFTHLSNLSLKLLEILWHKTVMLQNAFLITANVVDLNEKPVTSVKQMCESIKGLQLGNCFNPKELAYSTEWTSFFELVKLDWLNMDELINSLNDRVNMYCRYNSLKINNFVTKYFKSILAFHVSLEKILKSYGSANSTADRIGKSSLLLTKDMSSKDFHLCLTSYVGFRMTEKELIFLSKNIYNLKVDFVSDFKYELSLHDNVFKYITDDIMYASGNKEFSDIPHLRNKRWFFTSSLAAATGLTEQKEFDILSRNSDKIAISEERDAEEIRKLEIKANSILSAIKSQSESVLKLSTDENALHKVLQTVLDDEKSITNRLSHISQALESVSDVSIHYTSLLSSVSLMPTIIEDLESKILSILSQDLHPEMIPDYFPSSKIANYGFATLQGTLISAEITRNGYFVVYRIPNIVDDYKVKYLKSIPFVMDNAIFHRLKIEHSSIAVNLLGYTFFHEDRICSEKSKMMFCETSLLSINRVPKSCAEALSLDRSVLPGICKEKLQISVERYQSYIHHGMLPAISLFTPYNDLVTVLCDDNATVFNVTVGLSMITIPRHCLCTTKELVIYPSEYTTDIDVTVANLWTIDLSKELSSLMDDIAEIHEVNTSELSKDFLLYVKQVQVEAVDLSQVKTTVKNLANIKSMEEFSFTKLNLENPHHAATTALGWMVSGLTLIIVFITIKLCCCKPQKSCVKVFIKGIWFILTAFFKAIVYLICLCFKKQVPVYFRFRKKSKSKAIKQKIKWSIEINGCRALLTATLPSGKIFFNHLLGLVENEDGNFLRGLGISPSADTVNQYLKVLQRLDVPLLTESSLLVDDKDILYDAENRRFVSLVTNKPLYGFRLPPLPVV